MAGKIFINYRRDDSGGTAGRLHDRLAQTFGRTNLFMDVDHIPAGVDFVDYLPSQVAACDVFLAVIGPNWLDAKDDDGRRRFDNPDDFVMIEIAAALARNIRVIPVLVDGARTPKADKLPDSIKPLVRRNAVEVRNTNFGRDAEALVNKVREALKSPRPVTEQWPFVASAAAWLMAPGQWRTVAGSATALLLIGWIGLYQMGVPVWVPWTPRAEQPDPSRADKAKAAAETEAKLKAAEAEQQRQAKAEADANAKLKAAEAEQQRLAAIKDEEQRQAKAADGEAKLKAMEAEQQRLRDEVQRQTKAAADAEAQRKAAEAAQQRLKEEVQRQAKAAADAEQQRKAAEAEQQRLAAVKAEDERKAKAEAEAAAQRKSEEAGQQMVAFTITNNLEAMKIPGADESWKQVPSIGECEATCTKSPICKIFTYNKGGSRLCYMYSNATFQPNEKFDSGIRSDSGITSVLPASLATQSTGLFTIRSNTEAIATSIRNGYISTARARSIPECEQKCAQSQSPACKIFTYDRSSGMCYIYSDADFRPNEKFDSGVRK